MNYNVTWDSVNNQIVRANHNGIMLRIRHGGKRPLYAIYNLKDKTFQHVSEKLNTTARAWQRNYSTPYQFSTPANVNHRYIFGN